MYHMMGALGASPLYQGKFTIGHPKSSQITFGIPDLPLECRVKCSWFSIYFHLLILNHVFEMVFLMARNQILGRQDS